MLSGASTTCEMSRSRSGLRSISRKFSTAPSTAFCAWPGANAVSFLAQDDGSFVTYTGRERDDGSWNEKDLRQISGTIVKKVAATHQPFIVSDTQKFDDLKDTGEHPRRHDRVGGVLAPLVRRSSHRCYLRGQPLRGSAAAGFRSRGTPALLGVGVAGDRTRPSSRRLDDARRPAGRTESPARARSSRPSFAWAAPSPRARS